MYGGASMMGWGIAWMWAWPLLGLVGLILLGVVAYGLIRPGRANGQTSPSPSGSARDILAQRYARGEIDAEEYHRRLEALSPSST